MQYLKDLLQKGPDAKEMGEIGVIDEYVERYSSIVDEELNKGREGIKCSGEKISINNNLEIYKSTLKTIGFKKAEISIYIPNRHNSYTLYFNYNTNNFKGNYTELDEGTGLRIDHLNINLNKLEIYNKKTCRWDLMQNITDILKYELLGIRKILYFEIFNNYNYNKNLIINDKKDI